MQSLHNLRKFIVKKLYRDEFLSEDDCFFLEYYGKNLQSDDLEWIENKISSVKKNLAQIDDLIKNNSTNWNFERVGLVEKQILRLSIAEILFFPEVPVAVAMDEAIRLGKEFCGPKAAPYINGMLESVAREKSK
ncbi:transcription antitermination factor NusB [candidate division WOR-3 bacterium]|nr:transcription antitermination factor NusB [candidate division WOR-3 bacterium]